MHTCAYFCHNLVHYGISNWCIMGFVKRVYSPLTVVSSVQTITHPSKTDYRHMKTSSNGNIVRVTGHLCGEFTGHRWIPRTKASDMDLDVFFELRLNKRFSKHSWGWWFETPSGPLWRQCDELSAFIYRPQSANGFEREREIEREIERDRDRDR